MDPRLLQDTQGPAAGGGPPGGGLCLQRKRPGACKGVHDKLGRMGAENGLRGPDSLSPGQGRRIGLFGFYRLARGGAGGLDAGNGGYRTRAMTTSNAKAPAPRLACLKNSYGTPNRHYWLNDFPAWKAVDAQQAAMDYGGLKAKFQGVDGKAAAAGDLGEDCV